MPTLNPATAAPETDNGQPTAAAPPAPTPKPMPTKKTPAKPAAARKPTVEAAAVERTVVHPELLSLIAAEDIPGRRTVHPALKRPPINYDEAKQMLGWEDEDEFVTAAVEEARARPDIKADDLDEVALKAKAVFGGLYDFTDMYGKKVRCKNNSRNRPFNMENAMEKCQEHLQGRWRLNGEALVISKHGEIISAQHRLAGYRFAVQLWRGADPTGGVGQKEHWQAKWPTEPVLESYISYGVDDDEETVRTIDNVHAQTYSDTRYRQGAYPKLTRRDRIKATRMEDHAVKLLWDRTGLKDDSFAPRRSHAEAQDFVQRHQRLEQCVTHVFEEDKDGGITSSRPTVDGKTFDRGWSYLTPGYAAGLMFLMASSSTDGPRTVTGQIKRWAEADPAPSQDKLTWTLMKKAQQFWTDLAKSRHSGTPLSAVYQAFYNYHHNASGPVIGARMSVEEKVAVLCLAWARYRQDQPVREKDLVLKPKLNSEEIQIGLLEKETHVTGGIDLGWSKDRAQPDADPDADDAGDESAEQTAPAPVRKDKSKEDGLTDAELLAQRQAQLDKKNGGAPKADPRDQLSALREQYQDFVLLFKSAAGYNAFGVDADLLAKTYKVKVDSVGGLRRAKLPAGSVPLAQQLTPVLTAGHRVAVVEPQADGALAVVTEVTAVGGTTADDGTAGEAPAPILSALALNIRDALAEAGAPLPGDHLEATQRAKRTEVVAALAELDEAGLLTRHPGDLYGLKG